MRVYLLRPVLVLLTLAMLVVSLFQVAGRLMFSVLDELELAVNQSLSEQRIKVTGLTGDWHLLNPVIRIDRIELPAGMLDDVFVELDWIESLFRNRLVARRAALGAGRLQLEYGETGWRLAGATSESTFDPVDTLYHSDELDLNVRLGFTRDSESSQSGEDVLVRYLAVNRGGAHRHRLTLMNDRPACDQGCSLQLSADIEEAIAFVRPARTQLSTDAENFVIPRVVSGLSDLRLSRFDTRWSRSAEASGGSLDLQFDGFQMAPDAPVAGSLAAVARGSGDEQFGQITDLQLSTPSGSWQAPEIFVRYADQIVELWLARLEIGGLVSFVGELMPDDSAPQRWIENLELEGEALNLRSFLRIPGFEFGYAATVNNISMDGYKGAPWMRGGRGELLGSGRLIELDFDSESLQVQFPETFHETWVMADLQGALQAWISREYFALRGMNMRAEVDGNRVSGGFAVARPQQQFDEKLTLLVNVDQTSVERAKKFIPYRLPPGLPEWLEQGPQAGLLSDVAFAYHGQIHTRPFELARRVEFSSRIDEGRIQYHADWPTVVGLSGEIAVAGRTVRIRVEEGANEGGSKDGENLAGSYIVLGDNASYADIDLVSRSSLEQALAFVRNTPLAGWMSFITPGWSGQGMLDMRGRMHIPLKLDQAHIGEVNPKDELAVDLSIGLDGVDLALADYRVNLEDMNGDIRYVYPRAISGENVSGRLFGRPAVFGASADADTVTFHVNGQAGYTDVLDTLQMADPGNLQGGMDFVADLHIELGDEISRLRVATDLTGLAVRLPGGLSKQADDAVPTELEIRFLEDYQSLNFQYGAAGGWLHIDQTPLRGSIGVAGPAPLVDMSRNELAVGGSIDGFSLDEVVPEKDGGGGSMLSIDMRLVDLAVGHIDVGAIRFRDARLSGLVGQDALSVEFESPDLSGTVAITGDEPLDLYLKRLQLPGGGDGAGDPLDPELITELVAASVTVDSFHVGEDDYGAWMFDVAPEETGLLISNLKAELRGVIVASDRIFWQAQPNETSFKGTLTAGDLAQVLPLWGFTPGVSTETAQVEGELRWRGSPAMADLPAFIGEVNFNATNGRFSEVEAGGTGAVRIFSLINFSTIAKRLNFDFSDVVGEGVSFDSLTATAAFDEGEMRFVEPLKVEGSGSNFRVAGSVDLIDQKLNNEMIVTLPVSRSLPWYAAYIALANPLAGLGVLVGERVLRKPLEQFSSAKYQVSGTLQDPELKFVGVWDNTMDQPQKVIEPAVVPELNAPESTPPGEQLESPVNRPAEDSENHTG